MIDIEDGTIHWKLHLYASPDQVYWMISSDEGRQRFWAESATNVDGAIHFRFPNGQSLEAPILVEDPPHHYQIKYFGNSLTSFYLQEDGQGGTDLTLIDQDVPEPGWEDVNAGWVSVLMALKAALDFSVDLRNHDPRRTWDQGYVEN